MEPQPYSTLEVDPAQFAPQVAYSTEKQIPYDTTLPEFHDKSKITKKSRLDFFILPKRTVLRIFIASVVLVIIVGLAIALKISSTSKAGPKASTPISNSPSSTPTIANTPTDASPFSTTVAGLPTLPTGTFGISGVPETAVQTCINDTSQTTAWSCLLTHQVQLISYPFTSTISPSLTITPGNASDIPLYSYGMQTPNISTPMTGALVIDTDYPERGPAYLFSTSFNKVVILPENNFPGSSSSITIQNGTAQPGDRPWFCYWNSTRVEIFIYVNQTSSAGSSAGLSSVMTMTTGKATQKATSTGASTSATEAANSLAGYPKVVQMEDISEVGVTKPYCVQNLIESDGLASPVVDTSGNRVVFEIEEVATGGTSCGCQWVFT